MRLLLTSNGFPKEAVAVRDKLFELVNKNPTDIRVAFIPTASVVEDDRTFMAIDRQELVDIGIPEENITNLELDHPITVGELGNYDVVFVDGGNTFYLLEKMRESGFDKAIAEYISKDTGVFVGVSAGTIVMGPDIAVAEPWDDRSKGKLEDTKGLGYTKAAYAPHYKEESATILEELRSKANYEIHELRDDSAVLADEREERIIS